MTSPTVLSIAGSDPSGAAGIQADLKTFQALGVQGCTVITALTAQNRYALGPIDYASPSMVRSQLALLQSDRPAQALKLGMLGDVSVIEAVADFLAGYSGPVVCDPVLIASAGNNLFNGEVKAYLAKLQQIFPYIHCLTPNLLEAEALSGGSLRSYAAIEEAAKTILALGPKSVLIKGGDFSDVHFSQDYWTDGRTAFWLASARYPQTYRGTGCTLSSAIAVGLAQEYSLPDAIVLAKMTVNQGMRLAREAADPTKLLRYAGWPEAEADLPMLGQCPFTYGVPRFPSCDDVPLGLYPIVDSLARLELLLPLGIKTVQLRIKHSATLARDIQQAIVTAREHGVNLFINDHWPLAIRYGAYGIHLGQFDLDHADIAAIRDAGLRLGISTHSYAELARAHALKPSYIAYGPIFETHSKSMPFAPQGVERLKRWRKTINYPLVAIGGIDQVRLPDVLTAQPDGIAVISAIANAKDPVASTQALLHIISQNTESR